MQVAGRRCGVPKVIRRKISRVAKRILVALGGGQEIDQRIDVPEPVLNWRGSQHEDILEGIVPNCDRSGEGILDGGKVEIEKVAATGAPQ